MILSCFCFGDCLSNKVGGLVKTKIIVFVERKIEDHKTLNQQNYQALISDINQGFDYLQKKVDANAAGLKTST